MTLKLKLRPAPRENGKITPLSPESGDFEVAESLIATQNVDCGGNVGNKLTSLG